MINLGELKDRFFSRRPPTDPDRERDRIDKDDYRDIFARAEAFATVGPPTDHTLDPVTAPENVQLRARGGTTGIPETAELQAANLNTRGTSRGLEAARDALVEECGWAYRDAEALKREVERGDMTEQQMMRVVESELQRSSTSGRLVDPPTDPGPRGVDRRETSGRFVSEDRTNAGIGRERETGRFERVEQLVRGER